VDVGLRVRWVRTGQANRAVIAVDIGIVGVLPSRAYSEDAIHARLTTWADILVVVTLW
jgi:hypothetical protein